MGSLTAGDQLDAMLSGPARMIAAFCPVCGGWTMVTVSDSPNARQWIQMCYVAGELIMPIRTTDALGGPLCPQLSTALADRTCDL